MCVCVCVCVGDWWQLLLAEKPHIRYRFHLSSLTQRLPVLRNSVKLLSAEGIPPESKSKSLEIELYKPTETLPGH